MKRNNDRDHTSKPRASTMPLTPRPLHRLRLLPPCFFTAPYRNINRHSLPLSLPQRKLKFNVARSLPRRPRNDRQTRRRLYQPSIPPSFHPPCSAPSLVRSRDVFPAYYRAPRRCRRRFVAPCGNDPREGVSQMRRLQSSKIGSCIVIGMETIFRQILFS